jgi:hypothetical protein
MVILEGRRLKATGSSPSVGEGVAFDFDVPYAKAGYSRLFQRFTHKLRQLAVALTNPDRRMIAADCEFRIVEARLEHGVRQVVVGFFILQD